MNCCPRALRAAGLRLSRPTQNFLSSTVSRASPARPTPLPSLPRPTAVLSCTSFHSSAHTRKQPPPRRTPPQPASSDGNPPSAPRGATDFNSLDIFSNTPVPSTSVDICYDDGFKLNSGLQAIDGSGVMLVGGEAFSWRPWGKKTSLVNAKGQWEVDTSAFDLLSLVWPRPGMLLYSSYNIWHRMGLLLTCALFRPPDSWIGTRNTPFEPQHEEIHHIPRHASRGSRYTQCGLAVQYAGHRTGS